jgi:hypothetical protein
MRTAGDEVTGPHSRAADAQIDHKQAQKVDSVTQRMKEREDRQMLAWHEGRYGDEVRRQLGQRLDTEDKARRETRSGSREMLQRLDERPQHPEARQMQRGLNRPRGLER